MTFTLEVDGTGRFVCTLAEGAVLATLTASNVPAAGDDLESALEDARTSGYGECFWQEPDGTYWWMMRRLAMRLEVVVLWTSGGAAGWQHVFRAVTHAEDFSTRAADLIAGQSVPRE